MHICAKVCRSNLPGSFFSIRNVVLWCGKYMHDWLLHPHNHAWRSTSCRNMLRKLWKWGVRRSLEMEKDVSLHWETESVRCKDATRRSSRSVRRLLWLTTFVNVWWRQLRICAVQLSTGPPVLLNSWSTRTLLVFSSWKSIHVCRWETIRDVEISQDKLKCVPDPLIVMIKILRCRSHWVSVMN